MDRKDPGYRIVRAEWSNPDHTAAIMHTEGHGAVLATVDMADTWEHLQEWIAGGRVLTEMQLPTRKARDPIAELDALKAALRAKGIEV